MDPQQTVMCGGRSQDRVRRTEIAVDGLEAFQEASNGPWAYRDMLANLDVVIAQRAGDDPEELF